MRVLKSPAAVIDMLGGTGHLAEELGLSYRAVHNWRRRKGRIPPTYYPWMRLKLAEKNCTGAPALWELYVPKGMVLDA